MNYIIVYIVFSSLVEIVKIGYIRFTLNKGEGKRIKTHYIALAWGIFSASAAIWLPYFAILAAMNFVAAIVTYRSRNLLSKDFMAEFHRSYGKTSKNK